MLNAASGRCDCAPGYAAKSAASSRSTRGLLKEREGGDGGGGGRNLYITCSRCSSTTVSPGGGLGVAVCARCPAGTAPNKEGSLCITKGSWPLGSLDTSNRRWNSEEAVLSPASVQFMATKWKFTPDGDVSATPTVAGGGVFFPTWGGSVVALRASDGAQLWSARVEALLEQAGHPVADGDKGMVVSRTSIAYATSGTRALVVLGTMRRNIGGYPVALALDAATGALVWASKIHDHPAALLTNAATVHAGSVFMGVSSMEEARAGAMNYPCCSFRGAFVKVGVCACAAASRAGLPSCFHALICPQNTPTGAHCDLTPNETRARPPSRNETKQMSLATGAVQWTWYATPPQPEPNVGWSGGAVWGSMPAVDTARGLIYIGTGDK